jgi:hypothetical protein
MGKDLISWKGWWKKSERRGFFHCFIMFSLCQAKLLWIYFVIVVVVVVVVIAECSAFVLLS